MRSSPALLNSGRIVSAIAAIFANESEDVELGEAGAVAAEAAGRRGDPERKVDEELAFDFEDTLVGRRGFFSRNL